MLWFNQQIYILLSVVFFICICRGTGVLSFIAQTTKFWIENWESMLQVFFFVFFLSFPFPFLCYLFIYLLSLCLYKLVYSYFSPQVLCIMWAPKPWGKISKTMYRWKVGDNKWKFWGNVLLNCKEFTSVVFVMVDVTAAS